MIHVCVEYNLVPEFLNDVLMVNKTTQPRNQNKQIPTCAYRAANFNECQHRSYLKGECFTVPGIITFIGTTVKRSDVMVNGISSFS